VLKNFPTEEELRAALDGLAARGEIVTGRYYWRVACRFA
jgi:hypothetical protein